MNIKPTLLIIFSILFFNIHASASKEARKEFNEVWKINKDHSQVHFQVQYMAVSEIMGSFKHFDGALTIKEDGEITRARISIDTRSIDTHNKLRDGHLMGQDFFYSQKYPTIDFLSKKIELIAPNTYRASGELKVKGRSSKLIAEFSLSERQVDTWKYPTRFANFRFKINRDEIGLDWNKNIPGSNYLISKEVTVLGSFQMQPRSKMTPSSKHMIPNTKYTQLKDKMNSGELTAKKLKQEVNLEYKENSKVNGSSTSLNVDDKSKKAIIDGSIKESNLAKDKTFDFKWWASYLIVGLFGFIGMIFCALKIKFRFKDQTKEHEISGVATDYLIFPLGFLYAWAMWAVGFS